MVPDTIFAPAKINLHLAVFDKRPDGFHNLESIFLAVDFCDTLHFAPAETTEIHMNWDEKIQPEEIPLEKNIIYKTLSLFREKTGYVQGFKINVEKRIPTGSGLGGGSSNAASTLLALNELAGFPLKREQLHEMAAFLGSDVPFFIYKTGAALVRGRGECVVPLNAPDWFIVLVNPGFASDTAAAFRLLDEYRTCRTSEDQTQHFNFNEKYQLDRFPLLNFKNDFLFIFPEPEKTVYNKIVSCLKKEGAEFAGLSGTGSTCFGIFNEKTQADKAALSMSGEYRFVICCSLFKSN
ncbi:MAG: 4-(cytidine 5'-diphospho)-2-C-methyl-D-erythritol kinase [Treponema sp.]|nr:4-(cytidine 5'-diphospho)-2-C-methyl-D-erythritol kinase [Treponema sp.]MCL2272612.1 4-(cytidine 5'-diphospho)-2-C-methyl-D-erythritol kinase [Treponema sp.]